MQRLILLVAAPLAAANAAKGFVAKVESTIAPFVKSTNDRYANQSVGIVDGTLILKEANRMYGVAAEIKPPFSMEDKLVVQYEATLTNGLKCGGAYIKLLEAPVDTTSFDNESPYVLMFGPDRCGATDKVHFIVRQKNEKNGIWHEHHLRDAPKARLDQTPHLYKAVINADDTFAIYIDDEEAFSGSLMASLNPPLTPDKEIDDPDDSKPSDRVEAAKVDNWVPRKIPNAEYLEPKNPAKNLKPVGALAVDVWTTNGGIAYDAFYVGGSEVEAETAAASYYEKQKVVARKQAGALRKSISFNHSQKLCSGTRFCPLQPSAARRVFLFTMVAAESHKMLWHFLAHYHARGVMLHSHARFLVHADRFDNSSRDALAVLSSYHVPQQQIFTTRSYSSKLKENSVNAYLASLPADAWLLYVDADEFAEFPCNFDVTVQRPICGFLVDRTAAEPVMKPIEREPPLAEQFPMCSPFRYAAASGRLGASKTFLLPSQSIGSAVHFQGSHYAYDSKNRSLSRICLWTGWVSHYAWTDEEAVLTKKKREIYTFLNRTRSATSGSSAPIRDMPQIAFYSNLESSVSRGRIRDIVWEVAMSTRLSCCPGRSPRSQ